MEISLGKIKKNYGFKNILNNLSLEVKTKEKIALIGANGSGKTTILKIISGIEGIDDGSVSIKNGATIGFLSQIPEYNEEIAKDVLYSGLKKELELKDKLDECEQKLAAAEAKSLNRLINSYTKLQERFIKAGGYEIETRVSKLVAGFKINQEILNQKMNDLSGGERSLIYFASVMLSNPDILLLDEPTNHLDINRIEWLEAYLSDYQGTLMVVSHDRYFLDKIATKTILIERENTQVFHGNYSYYLKENETRVMLEFKNYNNQQKQIEAMKAAIKRLREWGKQGDNESLFKRANAIEKRLERIEELDKPITKKELPLEFNINQRSGKEVLKIKDLNISLGEKQIFNNASLNVYYNDKIAIVGPNGSGKTTLIKEILKNNHQSIKLGSAISIGYISQELEFDNDNLTVMDEAKKHYHAQEHHLRAALAKFLFYEDNVFKKIKYLSGGEKVRLKLFCLIQDKCNLLILDEPTNHIDIDTKEILENALLSFKGTILFISHDRYFINKIASRVVAIENFELINYMGNYDDYKNRVTVI